MLNTEAHPFPRFDASRKRFKTGWKRIPRDAKGELIRPKEEEEKKKEDEKIEEGKEEAKVETKNEVVGEVPRQRAGVSTPAPLCQFHQRDELHLKRLFHECWLVCNQITRFP